MWIVRSVSIDVVPERVTAKKLPLLIVIFPFATVVGCPSELASPTSAIVM